MVSNPNLMEMLWPPSSCFIQASAASLRSSQDRTFQLLQPTLSMPRTAPLRLVASPAGLAQATQPSDLLLHLGSPYLTLLWLQTQVLRRTESIYHEFQKSQVLSPFLPHPSLLLFTFISVIVGSAIRW